MITRPLGPCVDVDPRGPCYQRWVVRSRGYITDGEFYWRLHDRLWLGPSPLFNVGGPQRESVTSPLGSEVALLLRRRREWPDSMRASVFSRLWREVYQSLRPAEETRRRELCPL